MNRVNVVKRIVLPVAFSVALASLQAAEVSKPGASPGAGCRYATDAYPGFDTDDSLIKPEKKTPKWFSWFNGPHCTNAVEQFVYCRQLLADDSPGKAVRQLDALVREWPSSPEAPQAQQLLAETLLTEEDDAEEAFNAYRYLLDFHSLQCDYNAIADKLYRIAWMRREEGKRILWFRFANTIDVRHGFEACVLRAPGAFWVPEALLEIARLRTEEGKDEEAVKVYENLRNVHPGTPEAKRAVALEAETRMRLLKECAYNRARALDTRNYLKQALTACNVEDVGRVKGWLAETEEKIEDEAYRAAKFYDSRTRTLRSAISAYEKFLIEFPQSAHADTVKARIAALQEMEKKESK